MYHLVINELIKVKIILGENHIVIVLGANEKLSEADVLDASDAIEKCKVLLCQMEISECSTIKALQIKANSKNGNVHCLLRMKSKTVIYS